LRSHGPRRKCAGAADEKKNQKQKPIAPFFCQDLRLKRRPTQPWKT
jgi:hypothetical protein